MNRSTCLVPTFQIVLGRLSPHGWRLWVSLRSFIRIRCSGPSRRRWKVGDLRQPCFQ